MCQRFLNSRLIWGDEKNYLWVTVIRFHSSSWLLVYTSPSGLLLVGIFSTPCSADFKETIGNYRIMGNL